MMFEPIYQAGVRDWCRVLDTLSPVMAQRVRSRRMSIAHALHLVGVGTGAFDAPRLCDRPGQGEGPRQPDLFGGPSV